ncbi:hypothetical protein ACFQXA_15650 [Nocardiopsis composta]
MQQPGVWASWCTAPAAWWAAGAAATTRTPPATSTACSNSGLSTPSPSAERGRRLAAANETRPRPLGRRCHTAMSPPEASASTSTGTHTGVAGQQETSAPASVVTPGEPASEQSATIISPPPHPCLAGRPVRG